MLTTEFYNLKTEMLKVKIKLLCNKNILISDLLKIPPGY